MAKIRVESTKITQILILGKFHELYSDRYILSDETFGIIKILSSEVRSLIQSTCLFPSRLQDEFSNDFLTASLLELTMSSPSYRQRRQGRHRRQCSLPNEALYVPRSTNAENQNLTQLERQWSTGHDTHGHGTPVTSGIPPSFLSPDIESPFASTWASPGNSISNFVLGPAALHRDVSATPSLNSSLDEDAVSSVIHDAARITNWRSVLQLCRSNPEAAQYAGPDGWTALHHACNRRCPHADVAEALIRAYPDALLEIEEKGMTPLHYACRFKAPKEVVRLLLHLYPARGRAAVSARDKKGRTPLYYAVRYDAPPGVVELLLEVDPSVVLEEDRNADSPLALVWDSWAEKFEGKKTLQPFLHPDQPTDSETLKEMMNLPCNEKLLKKWKTVTLFLRAAFGFHKDGNRTFRALHATAAIKCHPSLYLLAKALYPEQASEMDDHDLYGSVQDSHQTALHLAARSPANGEAGRTVITTLLQLYPQAAQVADGIDGSLPLHRIVENERKVHWNFDGPRDLYRAYPLAARIADANGQLPLHRAAAAIAHHSGPASENTDGRSVVCSLVEEYPEAASQTDKSGRTPLHMIAECAEVWDEGVESILNAHPAAPRLRAGPELHNRLPIHMAAASPDARRSLIERLVELHPRGVSQADHVGKLPLHLACENGKRWDKGVRAIYDAFPGAIGLREANARGWMPLTMAAACPNAGADLIDELAELHPEAASEVDSDGRVALHWACATGKSWQGGLKSIFDANPDALLATDSNGHLPFHLAALSMCGTEVALEEQTEQVETPSARRQTRSATMSLRSPSITEPEPDAEAPKVEVLFQLIRAEPSIVQNVY